MPNYIMIISVDVVRTESINLIPTLSLFPFPYGNTTHDNAVFIARVNTYRQIILSLTLSSTEWVKVC